MTRLLIAAAAILCAAQQTPQQLAQDTACPWDGHTRCRADADMAYQQGVTVSQSGVILKVSLRLGAGEYVVGIRPGPPWQRRGIAPERHVAVQEDGWTEVSVSPIYVTAGDEISICIRSVGREHGSIYTAAWYIQPPDDDGESPYDWYPGGVLWAWRDSWDHPGKLGCDRRGEHFDAAFALTIN